MQTTCYWLSWCFTMQIAQACRPLVKGIGMWGSVKALARGYEYLMAVVIFTPVAILAWFPFVSEFQTRLLFNQAFSRGLQIQRILAGGKKHKQNWIKLFLQHSAWLCMVYCYPISPSSTTAAYRFKKNKLVCARQEQFLQPVHVKS